MDCCKTNSFLSCVTSLATKTTKFPTATTTAISAHTHVCSVTGTNKPRCTAVATCAREIKMRKIGKWKMHRSRTRTHAVRTPIPRSSGSAPLCKSLNIFHLAMIDLHYTSACYLVREAGMCTMASGRRTPNTRSLSGRALSTPPNSRKQALLVLLFERIYCRKARPSKATKQWYRLCFWNYWYTSPFCGGV